MDTKMIATVGALLVLGGGLYFAVTSGVLPGPGELDEPVDDPLGNGDDNGEDTDVNETAQPDNETEEEAEPLRFECEVQESEEVDDEFRDVQTRGGPPFDPRLAEHLLHEEINDVRDSRLENASLICDPELREIAQNHSETMFEGGFLGTERPDGLNLTQRYEGVCDNVTEVHGRWLYQRNQDPPFEWEGPPIDQRVDIIQDHEQLIRDIRGAWMSNDDISDTLLDTNMTRHGAGMHMDPDTRLIHVTSSLCEGDHDEDDDGDDEEDE